MNRNSKKQQVNIQKINEIKEEEYGRNYKDRKECNN